ncbi:LacI family DNA-binding transcriptional regulator [Lederbergia citrea]|uniref:LacI family DNA-binding transcriptional regulator n=1 Tax=Lederbergia citrea TaxID=2833581 RepID=UPI001BC96EDA|nr:LacI family DNA-binding transcriptional regulator [Lederbergia citrea]
MAKIIDVAKHANVSTATVSRVLRNPHAVKEVTRNRVLKSIEELNYQPNILARQLRRNKTNTILVVVPNILNTVFSHIVSGIEYTASQNNYRVIFGNTGKVVAKEYDYLNVLKQRQVDGMILLTCEIDIVTLNQIASEYSVVMVNEFYENLNMPIVSIDNRESGRMATEHLIKLGHKKIAHISGPITHYQARERFSGYKKALTQEGLELNNELIVEGKYTLESGYENMMKILIPKKDFTALFAANDAMAIGAMKAAKKLGYKIPRDLAIVGFDNIKMASIFEPELTTLAQPMNELGHKSMELLLESMENKQVEKKRVVLKTELIIRKSCGSFLRSKM